MSTRKVSEPQKSRACVIGYKAEVLHDRAAMARDGPASSVRRAIVGARAETQANHTKNRAPSGKPATNIDTLCTSLHNISLANYANPSYICHSKPQYTVLGTQIDKTQRYFGTNLVGPKKARFPEGAAASATGMDLDIPLHIVAPTLARALENADATDKPASSAGSGSESSSSSSDEALEVESESEDKSERRAKSSKKTKKNAKNDQKKS
jgi:hypothetical protein